MYFVYHRMLISMSTCLLVKVEMSHTLSSKLKHDADPCRCVVKCDVGKFPFLLFLSWSQQGMLCPCKSGVLLPIVPSAFLPAFALAQLGHPVLARVLCLTPACHSCKQALHFQWAFMLLETVSCSGDHGPLFSASQNCATSGAFLASVLC